MLFTAGARKSYAGKGLYIKSVHPARYGLTFNEQRQFSLYHHTNLYETGVRHHGRIPVSYVSGVALGNEKPANE